MISGVLQIVYVLVSPNLAYGHLEIVFHEMCSGLVHFQSVKWAVMLVFYYTIQYIHHVLCVGIYKLFIYICIIGKQGAKRKHIADPVLYLLLHSRKTTNVFTPPKFDTKFLKNINYFQQRIFNCGNESFHSSFYGLQQDFITDAVRKIVILLAAEGKTCRWWLMVFRPQRLKLIICFNDQMMRK